MAILDFIDAIVRALPGARITTTGKMYKHSEFSPLPKDNK